MTDLDAALRALDELYDTARRDGIETERRKQSQGHYVTVKRALRAAFTSAETEPVKKL